MPEVEDFDELNARIARELLADLDERHLEDGRTVRQDHVWSYDFVFDRTYDGRPLKILTLLDEYSRECLTIDVQRSTTSEDVIFRLEQLFVERGTPAYLRSDNGPEMTATALREWLARINVGTLYIEPGSPWENGYCESFNGKLRDAKLNGELFYTLEEAQVLIEMWRREYNQIRPHSSLGQKPPAPETWRPAEATSATLRPPRLVSMGVTQTPKASPDVMGLVP